MKFNINNYVRVKLTDRGREILRKNHEELSSNFSSVGEFVSPEKDGWYKQQLWLVMQEFGPHIYLGGPAPFETEIEIIEPMEIKINEG